MFPIPKSPICEASEEIKRAVARLFPEESTAKSVLPFVTMALRLRHQTGLGNEISAWQHSCIESLGGTYLELLAAHHFLDTNPDCSASSLNDAPRRKVSQLVAAEAELRLIQITNLPIDLEERRHNPTESMIRRCHTRLLGALALTLPYRDLLDFFKKYYTQHSLDAKAGLSFKSVLQEFSQLRGYGIPTYRVVSTHGPDHEKTFEIEVLVGKQAGIPACGNSKKRAEEAAAERWLCQNAREFLNGKIVGGSYTRKPNLHGITRPVVANLQGKTENALEHFKISSKSRHWLKRALVHPSFRGSMQLNEYEDNRTTSVLGCMLIQAGFCHHIASNYISTSDFHLRDASISQIASNAVSAEAIGSIADRLGVLQYICTGPQLGDVDFSAKQRAGFLEAIIAVKFLDQVPQFDVSVALGPAIAEHFRKIVSEAGSTQDLKKPLTRLLEFAGCQQINAESLESDISGPSHLPEVQAAIRFESTITQRALIIRGGRAANGKAARQSLSASLLPAFKAVHSNFPMARSICSNDLVDKLASLLLPTAFAAAPQTTTEAEKWRRFGLLGSGHLSEGDFESFSQWADEAVRYLEISGASIKDHEIAVLRFYSLIGSRRVWDLQSTAAAIVTAVKEFSSSNNALSNLRRLKEERFFSMMQGLLRVLSLAAKPRSKRTSVRDAFEDICLLRRREEQVHLMFDGPDFSLIEREGATVELCSEIVSAFSSIVAQTPLHLEVKTVTTDQILSVSIRCASADENSSQLGERLNSSLLVTFLKADGFIDAIHSDDHEVCWSVIPSLTDNFGRKARIAVESPFAVLEVQTRSALSKLLHDLKNHLIGAEIAVSGVVENRTLGLRAQVEASEHLDAAARLADQFASLSGILGRTEIVKVSLREFFKRLYSRLFTILPSSISLIVPGETRDLSVWTCEQFVDSIIDNLIQNSVDAMNRRGRLELNWEVDEEACNWLIKIKDNGPGIPDELLRRLLGGEPVASTKPGGSGVGMLTVISMLRRLGGRISGSNGTTSGIEWTVCIPSMPPIEPDLENSCPESAILSTE